MPRPRHPRPDANQPGIVKQLQELGFLVLDVSPICAYADLYVSGWNPICDELQGRLFEIKTATGKLTREQQIMVDNGWVQVARSVEDVLRAFRRVA